MQTFVPYDDHMRSAEVLDLARLGKQVIEAGQIIRALSDPDYGWQSHPATAMWRGHRGALFIYTACMHAEWFARRGKVHGAWTNLCKWLTDPDRNLLPFPTDEHEEPGWLGRDDVHGSHRANLLRKDPIHYGAYGWTEDPALPYVWPATEELSA